MRVGLNKINGKFIMQVESILRASELNSINLSRIFIELKTVLPILIWVGASYCQVHSQSYGCQNRDVLLQGCFVTNYLFFHNFLDVFAIGYECLYCLSVYKKLLIKQNKVFNYRFEQNYDGSVKFLALEEHFIKQIQSFNQSL